MVGHKNKVREEAGWGMLSPSSAPESKVHISKKHRFGYMSKLLSCAQTNIDSIETLDHDDQTLGGWQSKD